MQRTPDGHVVAWVDAQDRPSITATTLAELLDVLARLPDGVPKATLAERITEMVEGPVGGRVLAFGRAAASRFAVTAAARERAGHPISVSDCQIVAICHVHGMTLATQNIRWS